MQITRIIAKNYRTYLNLDMDLSVEEGKPIILIGGANGGGKTTLFNAIHGALYGLSITSAEHFKREVNAGTTAAGEEPTSIELEIHFSGFVLSQEQRYILKRGWELVDQTVRYSVMLNLHGNIIRYGSATPDKEKQTAESQVCKIIKANLPQELSEYFLFDAMKAGEKLTDMQLSRIIRENIEIVMGFRKYLDLAKAADRVREAKAAERLKAKGEREEYLRLVAERRTDLENLAQLRSKERDSLEQLHALNELVTELKKAQNQETVLKNKRTQLEEQKTEIHAKEKQYVDTIKEFVKDIALTVGLPQLAKSLRSEVPRILAAFGGTTGQNATIGRETATVVVEKVLECLAPFLNSKGIPTCETLVDSVLADQKGTAATNPWSFLERDEVSALANLVRAPRTNPFTTIDIMRNELAVSIPQIARINLQIDDVESQMAGKDYSSLKRYEELDALVNRLKNDIANLEATVREKEKRLQRYDIQIQEEPDPKYEALCRLVKYFEESADALLKAKKQRLEELMRDDLNVNLAAYRGVIAKVDLSENLRNLSFKLFHKAGNEIYLDQLNAASKQVVVQVLLKALHQYGDYDPPVMIDTVMGVLDKESRAIILEHYFPSLAHQTILLSTDSEIDPATDLQKVAAFVSKGYTLVRDKEAQKTTVDPLYFGIEVKEQA
jgi:DNA sulfur modification protein DndD